MRKVTVDGLVLVVGDNSFVDVTNPQDIKVETLATKRVQSHVFKSQTRPGVTHKVTYRDGQFFCDCEHFEHHKDNPQTREHCWHIQDFKRLWFVPE